MTLGHESSVRPFPPSPLRQLLPRSDVLHRCVAQTGSRRPARSERDLPPSRRPRRSRAWKVVRLVRDLQEGPV